MGEQQTGKIISIFYIFNFYVGKPWQSHLQADPDVNFDDSVFFAYFQKLNKNGKKFPQFEPEQHEKTVLAQQRSSSKPCVDPSNFHSLMGGIFMGDTNFNFIII